LNEVDSAQRNGATMRNDASSRKAFREKRVR
jgi:hypothetical protein